MIPAGGPEWDSLLESVVGSVDSGLVGLCMKGPVQGKSFIISRNWRRVPPASGGTLRASGAPGSREEQLEGGHRQDWLMG